jgi:hypothetical protein
VAIGLCTIDTGRTFAALLLVASGPRNKFQTAEQDLTPEGLPKWEVNVSAVWLAETGRRPALETIRVTIPAPSNPAAALPIGSPVDLDGLRIGHTGQGQVYWQADTIRATNGTRKE